MLKSIITTCALVLILSCQKKAPSRADFSMVLSALKAKKTLYTGETVPITLRVSGLDHRIHIVGQMDKRGAIQDDEGRVATDWYIQRDGEKRLHFKPLEAGAYKIHFQALDGQGKTESKTLVFKVKDPVFALSERVLRQSLDTSESAVVNFEVDPRKGAVPNRFSFTSNLKGKLSYRGKTYAAGESVPIGGKTEFTV